jgi:ribosomal protein S18 acetylase RimI-like enzyme
VANLVELVRATGVFRPEEVAVAEELLVAGAEKGEASGYLFRVAEAEGRAAGYACYGPTPCTEGTFDLYWIAVAPGLQGSGVASRLLFEVESDVKSRRGRLLVAETEDSPSYRSARAFYEARGFRRAATVPDFYQPGNAKVIYTKELTESTGGH